MILGLVLFFGVHTLTTQRAARARVIGLLGEGGYKIGYSLVSVAGFALIVWGFANYRATGWIDVWYPPTFMKHHGRLMRRPSSWWWRLHPRPHLHAEAPDADRDQIVGGALARQWRSQLHHPVRSFLAWAVFDRITLKRRSDGGGPPIPVGGPGNDLIAIAVGIIAYLALAFAFHPVVIGVPVVGA